MTEEEMQTKRREAIMTQGFSAEEAEVIDLTAQRAVEEATRSWESVVMSSPEGMGAVVCELAIQWLQHQVNETFNMMVQTKVEVLREALGADNTCQCPDCTAARNAGTPATVY